MSDTNHLCHRRWEHSPEGFIRSDEVKAFILAISNCSSSGFNQSDSNSILKTLDMEKQNSKQRVKLWIFIILHTCNFTLNRSCFSIHSATKTSNPIIILSRHFSGAVCVTRQYHIPTNQRHRNSKNHVHREQCPGAMRKVNKRDELRVCQGCRHLLALVQPDLFRVDGCVHFGLGSFQFEEATLLAVDPGAKARPPEHQLVFHPLLQCAHPPVSLC